MGVEYMGVWLENFSLMALSVAEATKRNEQSLKYLKYRKKKKTILALAYQPYNTISGEIATKSKNKVCNLNNQHAWVYW